VPGEDKIVFNPRPSGSWGEEERIKLGRRFASEEGANTLVHDEGRGFQVWIDWVHAIVAKRAKEITYQASGTSLVAKEPLRC
jgi:hypothetical protein